MKVEALKRKSEKYQNIDRAQDFNLKISSTNWIQKFDTQSQTRNLDSESFSCLPVLITRHKIGS